MTFELEANSMETFITQGLGWTDQDTRSITPPIYPSTTYERNSDLSYHKGRIYTRADNPTYDRLKALLTKLENGKEALLFSSGMSATVAIFQSLSPGDHIIASKNVYKGVKDWIFRFAHPWGIDFNLLPDNDPKTLTKNIKPGKTKIIWIETPTNPMMEITDITAFCQIAHRSKSLVVVDNTVSTPILTRPLEYGADLVLHSATKYLNGHGDVLAGALITKEDCELWKRIKLFTHDAGALPGPFEVWLVQRGIRTLHLRMKRSCDNAHKIAEYFKNHPKIDDIYYPGLKEFPGYHIASKQMTGGYGAIMSMRIRGGFHNAVQVQANTKVFRRSTSLGMVESLIEHRASYEGKETSVPDDLLRLSCGLENAEDLIKDLELALESIN